MHGTYMQDNNTNNKKTSKKQIIYNAILIIVSIIACTVFILNTFFIGKYEVNGSSMESTLVQGDILWGWTHAKPKVNDIVVVDMRGKDNIVLESKGIYMYIKRVVALGGDKLWEENGTLYILRSDGTLTVDNSLYTTFGYFINTSRDNPIIIDEEMMFIMGDNRKVSHDSRAFGQLEVSRVVAVIIGNK